VKTSGFREIDFSKTECKNCGIHEQGFSHFHTGKISQIIYDKQTHPMDDGIRIKFIDCPVCKGAGFIDESVTTELDLK